MVPADAFLYLYEKNLPLILSFPFEEERGHFITGRGLCCIEKIYDASKVVLAKFSPRCSLGWIRTNKCFFANFEAMGRSYSCLIDDIIVDREKIVAPIPQTLNPYSRRFIRVEPSVKLPVVIYMFSPEYGTISVPVRDISERGVSFLSQVQVNADQEIICGIRLPVQGETLIMSRAAIRYRIDSRSKRSPQQTKSGVTDPKPEDSACYGIELFPHAMDENKIRIYIMQRDVEIRRTLKGL